MTTENSNRPRVESPATALATLVGEARARAAIRAGWDALRPLVASGHLRPGTADYAATVVVLATHGILTADGVPTDDLVDDGPGTLWAVHVEGPDDVIPMPDRTTAEQAAARCNAGADAFRARPDYDPDHDAIWHAAVTPWPWDPEGHAEALADLRKDDPDGWLRDDDWAQTGSVCGWVPGDALNGGKE